MIVIKETAGDSLQGTIDGVNKTFEATNEFLDSDSVDIYVNGRLKVRSWDDGFSVVLPKTVILNEAPLVGDSLTIEYKHPAMTGGGADGGCPSAPEIVIIKPETQAMEYSPGVLSENIEPGMSSNGELSSSVFTESLRPVILTSEEG